MKPLTQKVLPEIKLEPHEVDQFLNLSSKEGLLNTKWKYRGWSPESTINVLYPDKIFGFLIHHVSF